MITNAFKRCGMYNDIDGKENHLVKLDKRMPNYAPAKDAPRSVVKKTKKRKRKNKATGSKAKKKQKKN